MLRYLSFNPGRAEMKLYLNISLSDWHLLSKCSVDMLGEREERGESDWVVNTRYLVVREYWEYPALRALSVRWAAPSNTGQSGPTVLYGSLLPPGPICPAPVSPIFQTIWQIWSTLKLCLLDKHHTPLLGLEVGLVGISDEDGARTHLFPFS